MSFTKRLNERSSPTTCRDTMISNTNTPNRRAAGRRDSTSHTSRRPAIRRTLPCENHPLPQKEAPRHTHVANRPEIEHDPQLASGRPPKALERESSQSSGKHVWHPDRQSLSAGTKGLDAVPLFAIFSNFSIGCRRGPMDFFHTTQISTSSKSTRFSLPIYLLRTAC